MAKEISNGRYVNPHPLTDTKVATVLTGLAVSDLNNETKLLLLILCVLVFCESDTNENESAKCAEEIVDASNVDVECEEIVQTDKVGENVQKLVPVEMVEPMTVAGIEAPFKIDDLLMFKLSQRIKDWKKFALLLGLDFGRIENINCGNDRLSDKVLDVLGVYFQRNGFLDKNKIFIVLNLLERQDLCATVGYLLHTSNEYVMLRTSSNHPPVVCIDQMKTIHTATDRTISYRYFE
ncbi:uncharacterized protein LOC130636466 isoform X2 [Hydractinia symbiolongicarpus]|uniref:uncharacterized protein LOC130636466 isoform X2 n=1 Tax=Hydractinia symbiolongicarpus TaxID=13093 RepID=UPI002550D695|nr:uncharacterized protein LOC130636466 isoform X2 [Hydractinia symbiolongicarpus]